VSASLDRRVMGAALALSERGRARTGPNPNVGCMLVKHGIIIGRGWTQPGGRPHAEAMALTEAGDAARGATAYVTLEPCAHASARGAACTESLIAAGIARVIVATRDPDPRTNGAGIARMTAAGIQVEEGVRSAEAIRGIHGWWCRTTLGRPAVTLKLATSLDGCIAMADGRSRWITGERARAHAHLERARHDAILVGRRTLTIDEPRLDVRLAGLAHRAPRRILLSSAPAPEGWTRLTAPAAIADLADVNDLLVEGGAATAAAFLAADLVDRLLLYRAPILIGGGRPAIGDIGLGELDAAHGRWCQIAAHQLGSDRLEVYERIRTA